MYTRSAPPPVFFPSSPGLQHPPQREPDDALYQIAGEQRPFAEYVDDLAGSCTMKLNAATEMMPLSWRQWAQIHPFAPAEQAAGYRYIASELEKYLCEVTAFDACSLQPNSGAQGEYAGTAHDPCIP